MRLSHELEVELRIRLEAVATEQLSGRTIRELPVIDAWAIGIIFLASIVAVYCMR